MKEAEYWKVIETHDAKLRQGQRTDLSHDILHQGTQSPQLTRDKVAERVGLGSGVTYARAEKVWEEAKRGNPIATKLIGGRLPPSPFLRRSRKPAWLDGLAY